jgi:hypothetical protein
MANAMRRSRFFYAGGRMPVRTLPMGWPVAAPASVTKTAIVSVS